MHLEINLTILRYISRQIFPFVGYRIMELYFFCFSYADMKPAPYINVFHRSSFLTSAAIKFLVRSEKCYDIHRTNIHKTQNYQILYSLHYFFFSLCNPRTPIIMSPVAWRLRSTQEYGKVGYFGARRTSATLTMMQPCRR